MATNRAESGEKVVEWHRGKAGTVEHVHDEMKNDLAAARPPSQKFGANAAWFALNAVAYNMAAALRAADPEPENRVRRVRGVRFHVLTAGARLSRLSRKIVLRFAAPKEWVKRVLELLEAFPCRVCSPPNRRSARQKPEPDGSGRTGDSPAAAEPAWISPGRAPDALPKAGNAWKRNKQGVDGEPAPFDPPPDSRQTVLPALRNALAPNLPQFRDP
ncbi:MAG: transposase [Kiritimatiellia bacterium]